MQFKIKNIKIKISFTFFALILLFITLGKTQNILPALLFSFLHECGHIFVLFFTNEQICEFNLGMFGAEIAKKESLKTDFKKEILINLGGPIVNLIFSVIFLFSGKTMYFYINLIICLFNLLPIYSLDGGKALTAFLNILTNERKAVFIITVISYLFAVPLIIFSFIILYNSKAGIQFLILSTYILLTLIFKN